ncbi:uncharacterized protein LOC131078845 [Cryptomeria japonica]|uniref:uncharacterized protein LOC131078845 n=1 Tax=Cryptomeria japonica TaxID=3369 RepID=UPI0025ACC4E1|nr:uncharacterized protein LOC131078845 [Cryptomeria japonica]
MARWIGMESSGSAGSVGFVAVVVCVLAVAALVTALCATHFRKEEKTRKSDGHMDQPACNFVTNFKLPPKSPGRAIFNSLSGPKKLLLSRKWGKSEEDELKAYDSAVTEEGDFLWQRSILMGERCKPPDFSGMIIYDDKGNRLPHFPPRSPKLNLFHPSLEAEAQR